MRRAHYWLTALLCAALVVACAPASGTAARSGAPAVAGVVGPTMTPAPTPLPQIRPDDPIGNCTLDPNQGPYLHIGDLVVSTPRFVLAYPAHPLPDGEPPQPFALNDAAGDGNFTQTTPVNPVVQQVGKGYGFTICNTAAHTSHIVSTFLARIDSFSPSNPNYPLLSWQPCDGSYSRAHGVTVPTCGGTQPFDAYVQARFSAGATTGAVVDGAVTTPQHPTAGSDQVPVTVLAPGQTASINISILVPTLPGSYTFSFALSGDGFSAVTFATPQPALFAPVASTWTGAACAAPAMLAQIPATPAGASYICPATYYTTTPAGA